MPGRRNGWFGAAVVTALAAGLAALVAALILPGLALGHLERPSYWPDPAPDRSVEPAAGGEVPEQRSLRSAVTGKGPGEVRVVCRGHRRSLRLAKRSIRRARKHGFRIRPSQPKEHYSRKRARRMVHLNERLRRRCEYRHIQAAIEDSHNNDRVVIMPGRYTERPSRRAPTDDPRCADLTVEDTAGRQAPSYEYQVTCPNDQNLIHVAGRKVPAEPPPSPPLEDRTGIPDLGPCMRCDLQIEGSGAKPTDVLIDAGRKYGGHEKSHRPGAKPEDHAKHIGLRLDRADGFVVANLTIRGALEHGLYTEETDGFLVNEVKLLWNGEYGYLSFTSDHGVIKNCDGYGSGDSVVYPGAAPETGEQNPDSFYPDGPRVNTVVKHCDLRGSVLGYSGSMGNAVRITKNHIYGNTAGINTDTFSSQGHPGFPADSVEIDHNLIYSNNLNLYTEDPPVEPTVPITVGTGIFWPGHNNGNVHDNWIFDNWRRGTMLFQVPDVFLQPEGKIYEPESISCETATAADPSARLSTSCGNRYHDNVMGRLPKGFDPPKPIGKFGNRSSLDEGRRAPNGVDFWWDEGASNDGNCWFDNIGADGSKASITGPGDGQAPDVLPGNCRESVGGGDPLKLGRLVACVLWEDGQTAEDVPRCVWFKTPPEPGSAAARRQRRELRVAGRDWLGTEDASVLGEQLDDWAAFAHRP